MSQITVEWKVNGKVLKKGVNGKKAITIGRHPACDIVLGDPHVSRRHATIYCTNGTYHIHNLSQTNPIVFNEHWNLGHDFRADLKPGDNFLIGRVPMRVKNGYLNGNGVGPHSNLKARCPSCSQLMDFGEENCAWCGASLADAETVELEEKLRAEAEAATH